MSSIEDKQREDFHEDDIALNAFLRFLEKNIEDHPETLTPLTKERLMYWRTLGSDEYIDLDRPIPPSGN